MTKFHIADDFELIRYGLKNIIESMPNCEVTSMSENGEEAIETIKKEKPQVAILDISMPVKSGVEVLALIKTNDSLKNTKVIMHSVHNEFETISLCKQLGADGYIFKDSSDDEIKNAINTIIADGTYFSNSVKRLEALSENIENYKLEMARQMGINSTENAILKLIVNGKSNEEIKFILNMETDAFEKHHNQLREKLNAKSVADLVRISLKNNLV